MRPHTRIPARAAAGTGAAAIHRGRTALARAGLAVGVLAAAAVGTVLAEAGPAAAAPAVLYAAAAAAGTGDCSTAADACTLSTALTSVASPAMTAGAAFRVRSTPVSHLRASSAPISIPFSMLTRMFAMILSSFCRRIGWSDPGAKTRSPPAQDRVSRLGRRAALELQLFGAAIRACSQQKRFRPPQSGVLFPLD